MRLPVLMAVTIGLCLGAGQAALSQQPAPPLPVPGPAAAPPEYGLPIGNEQAKSAAATALAEAMKNNWRMAVAVVGPDGDLIYFEKMDGTQNASPALAIAKARAAVLFRRSTKAFADQFAAGNTGFMSFPNEARPIASEGGIPITLDGKIIGAIGASGGTGQQDGIAATAGANAVK
jgi:uncharacterized protein GlcG (DUF336 family)